MKTISPSSPVLAEPWTVQQSVPIGGGEARDSTPPKPGIVTVHGAPIHGNAWPSASRSSARPGCEFNLSAWRKHQNACGNDETKSAESPANNRVAGSINPAALTNFVPLPHNEKEQPTTVVAGVSTRKPANCGSTETQGALEVALRSNAAITTPGGCQRPVIPNAMTVEEVIARQEDIQRQAKLLIEDGLFSQVSPEKRLEFSVRLVAEIWLRLGPQLDSLPETIKL